MPTLRICAKGHRYYKSSDCPTCPVCEKLSKPQAGLLSGLSAPARRALQQLGISSAKELANYSESSILALHGIGKTTIPKLTQALKGEGLSFKKNMTIKKSPKTVDDYISTFDNDVQVLLSKMRTTIQKAAPAAEEFISYGMPAYRLNGMLVYFAAFKSHIGFYATPTGHEAFKKELSVYKTGKGSVQFPFNKPLPLALITRIVKFRVKQNKERASKK